MIEFGVEEEIHMDQCCANPVLTFVVQDKNPKRAVKASVLSKLPVVNFYSLLEDSTAASLTCPFRAEYRSTGRADLLYKMTHDQLEFYVKAIHAAN